MSVSVPAGSTKFAEMAALLDTASPILSLAEVAAIADDVFGITATVSELAGERDRNFHLAAGEMHYVLKVSNPAEDRRVIDFQTRALLHIASVDPALPVPRVARTRSGAPEWLLDSGAATRVVRVLSFLQGEPLDRVAAGAELRRDLGRHVARLGLALRGFFHPAAGHELMWDLKHASRARELLVHIPDGTRRALAARFLDQFETHALPALPRLRAQVIHNDLNPHNVLVASDDHERIAGVIDFGDLVHAPLVDDLAIAAAYQVTSDGHPLQAIAHLVGGYHEVMPLEPAEIDLLYDLIATRMVLTVAIGGWRAARYPENAGYILRNNLKAWNGLERLAALTRADAQAHLRAACQVE